MASNRKAGGNPASPSAVTGAEYVLVGPGIALLKHGYDAWKDRTSGVSESDPLAFAVSQSDSDAVDHRILVSCVNLGRHGVYLEAINLAEPKGSAATVQMAAKGGGLFGGTPKVVSSALPLLIKPSVTYGFQVSIPRFAADRLKKSPFGKLKVVYTVCGVASGPKDKAVEFAVRV